MNIDRWVERGVRCGPFTFLLRCPIRRIIAEVSALYRDYPDNPVDGIYDYTVSVAPPNPLRRWVRPRVDLACDVEVPFMAPQPASHGLLALEMGMNLQIAAGMHRYLLLHAGSAARDGGGLILTGESGSGKSTMAAILGWSGWQFLGDEFALVSLDGESLLPFPRPASLKDGSITLLEALAPADRFGPVFDGTMKGRIRHCAPPAAAIAAMDTPVRPRLILSPTFIPGMTPQARRMGMAETLVRLSQSSTNYRALGETGFDAMMRLAETPAYEVTWGDSAGGVALIEELWAAHG